jgi:hypothetical protein
VHVRVGRPLAVVALVVGLLIAVPAWSGWALADGDPASDVLAETPVFFPADASIPAARQSQSLGLVRAAQRRGYPIRVALIAKQDDLGSVAALWNQRCWRAPDCSARDRDRDPRGRCGRR